MTEEGVKEFMQWLVSVGCPGNKIPSEKKIKEVLQSGILSVDELKSRFHPYEEAKSIKEKYLRIKLCKIKQDNFLIADRKAVPEEYQRYVKLNALKKEVKEADESVKEIKAKIRDQKLQLKEINHVKREKQIAIEEFQLQTEYLKKNHSVLEEKITEIITCLKECDAAWICPPGQEGKNKDCQKVIEEMITLLDTFYKQPEPKENLHEKLWESLTKVIKNTPNSALCRELLQKLVNLMELMGNLLENSQNIQDPEKDKYYEARIGVSRFMADRVKLVLIRHHYKKKLKELTDVYVVKYDDFRNLLTSKYFQFDPDFIIDFIQKLLLKASFTGQIDFLKAEKSACENPMEDCQEIQKELQGFYDEFLAEAKKIELEITQLKGALDKLEYTQEMQLSRISGMKALIQQQEQEKEKIKEEASFYSSQIVKQEQFEEDTIDQKTEPQTVLFPPPLDLDFKPPISEYYCNELKNRVVETENSLKTIALETEIVAQNVADELNKADNYLNFVLENPLRKFVPPEKKVNGHTYQEYETEFEIHYRQVNGKD